MVGRRSESLSVVRWELTWWESLGGTSYSDMELEESFERKVTGFNSCLEKLWPCLRADCKGQDPVGSCCSNMEESWWLGLGR